MHHLKSLALVATVGLSLAGCSVQTISTAPAAVNKPTPVKPVANPWQQRQAVMGSMQSWSMGGRAALRFQGDAWTFGLNWLQKSKQQYTLQIKNPVTGTVVGVLEQSPGKAVLRSQGKVYSGTDAERLLKQRLRVTMPVNGMPYWVRGVMAPQFAKGTVKLDAKGRPTQITQAGWVMDYSKYQGDSYMALPGKVNISRAQDKVNVKILAKQWKTQ